MFRPKVIGFLNMKILAVGVVFATPLAVSWVWRGGEASAVPAAGVRQISAKTAVMDEPTVKVPVEVLSKGSAPQWVYVEVGPADSVPEPGVFPLVVLPALALVMRRRREK